MAQHHAQCVGNPVARTHAKRKRSQTVRMLGPMCQEPSGQNAGHDVPGATRQNTMHNATGFAWPAYYAQCVENRISKRPYTLCEELSCHNATHGAPGATWPAYNAQRAWSQHATTPGTVREASAPCCRMP